MILIRVELSALGISLSVFIRPLFPGIVLYNRRSVNTSQCYWREGRVITISQATRKVVSCPVCGRNCDQYSGRNILFFSSSFFSFLGGEACYRPVSYYFILFKHSSEMSILYIINTHFLMLASERGRQTRSTSY